MRKNLRMIYVKNKARKGYMGHWCMDYYVDNVVDKDTNETILDSYVFKESTIFKGKGFKSGDIVEMSAIVSLDRNNKLKIRYYKDVKRVEE